MNIFITGTDTDCGKTWVTSALLRAAGDQGIRALGMKPIASGAERRDGEWHNDDVAALRAASSVEVPARTMNPYIFELPASPNIAAQAVGADVNLDPILAAYADCAEAADWVVVEGVGGWLVPLNTDANVADLAAALALPVVLVVGLKLGCINHALLSAAAMTAAGTPCIGWIANRSDDDMAAPDAVINTLTDRLPWPLLAVTAPNDGHSLGPLVHKLAALEANAGSA